MTQEMCGICGQAPSKHSQDQIHKCFSDAGFEVEFEVGDALYIAREFELVRKYSPGSRGYPAKVWFRSNPEDVVETADLPTTVFKEALPLLEKKAGGAASGLENPLEESDEEPEDQVWDDETLARMEEVDPPDKSEG